MATDRPNRRSSDRLTILADALLLTALAGAALAVIRNLATAPIPFVDAFLTMMAISSVVGATGAWLLHRRHTGARGFRLLAGGLVVAILLIVGCEAAIVRLADSLPVFATALFSVVQLAGLAFIGILIFAGAKDLLRPGRRRFQTVAVTRVAALAGIAAVIAFRFLPETQADPIAARVDAVLALATIGGAIAVGIADVGLHAKRRRTADTVQDDAPPSTIS